MRLTGLIEYCALVAGAVAIVAGKYFSLHKGVELGYFLIGFSFLIGGLVSIYTMQTSSPLSARGANNWSGAQAIIFGLMQLLAGAALIGHAYALSAGRWPTIINYISARPGPVLAAVGLVLTGAGLLLIIGVGKTNSTLRFVLTGIPRMLFGVTFLAIGVAAASVGVWDWFDHRGFEHFANDLAARLNLPEPTSLWRKVVLAMT